MLADYSYTFKLDDRHLHLLAHMNSGREMESVSFTLAEGVRGRQESDNSSFQMPLHYPRYSRSDYEIMPEWQLDRLLSEYGLPVIGNIKQKRSFAMGAFLWSH